jgi:hypothetical protein
LQHVCLYSKFITTIEYPIAKTQRGQTQCLNVRAWSTYPWVCTYIPSLDWKKRVSTYPWVHLHTLHRLKKTHGSSTLVHTYIIPSLDQKKHTALVVAMNIDLSHYCNGVSIKRIIWVAFFFFGLLRSCHFFLFYLLMVKYIVLDNILP